MHRLLRLKICFLIFSILAIRSPLSYGQAVENSGKTAAEAQTAPASTHEFKGDDFKYVLEGRPDPFVPFLAPKVATKINQDEIIDEAGNLSGMRKFEPGQLTLVAVLSSNGKKMAMVEDVTGKGYILNEGTPIGRRGIVSQINKQQVVITETAHTRAGKKLITTVVMRLNKEGDQ